MQAFRFSLLSMIVSSGVCAATATGDTDGRYHAQSWQDAVTTLPCSAFVGNSNGTWTMPGAVALPDNAVVSNMTFGPNEDSRKLDARCRPAGSATPHT